MRPLLAFLLALFVWLGTAQAEVAVPPLRALVTDLTRTLSPAEVAALDSRLKAYEREKGSQIAVLIVPTTQPEEIEQYSMRVVEQWKLGRSKVDDGVLFLIAKNDHTMRIEVGYGLEGALPDITAKQIISDTVSPRFKSGDFIGGIIAGVDAIIAAIKGESLPVPKASSEQGDAVGFVVFGGVCGAILSFMFKRFLHPQIAVPLATVLTGLLAWLLFSWAMALLATFFALLGALGLFNNIRGLGGFRGSNSGGRWGGGGGGRFGGGGASGRW